MPRKSGHYSFEIAQDDMEMISDGLRLYLESKQSKVSEEEYRYLDSKIGCLCERLVFEKDFLENQQHRIDDLKSANPTRQQWDSLLRTLHAEREERGAY